MSRPLAEPVGKVNVCRPATPAPPQPPPAYPPSPAETPTEPLALRLRRALELDDPSGAAALPSAAVGATTRLGAAARLGGAADDGWALAVAQRLLSDPTICAAAPPGLTKRRLAVLLPERERQRAHELFERLDDAGALAPPKSEVLRWREPRPLTIDDAAALAALF